LNPAALQAPLVLLSSLACYDFNKILIFWLQACSSICQEAANCSCDSHMPFWKKNL